MSVTECAGANSGVGFAIPIDSVRGLVDQILKYGRVVRPTIGITIAPPQVLRQIEQEGVLILEVPDKTPAARAGLKGTYRYLYSMMIAKFFAYCQLADALVTSGLMSLLHLLLYLLCFASHSPSRGREFKTR